jgi:hypothetical protein
MGILINRWSEAELRTNGFKMNNRIIYSLNIEYCHKFLLKLFNSIIL